VGFLPSTSVPDGDYLLERSTTEAALAARARTEPAAAAHRTIARCYLAKLFGERGTIGSDGPASDQAAEGEAMRLARSRFADLTSMPENAELTQVLRRIP
jgi:hypothetical protein